MLRKRTDWTRPLPQPRQKSTWQYVAGLALDAASGGDGADLSIALRMVLSL
jgi:hypothetical protein